MQLVLAITSVRNNQQPATSGYWETVGLKRNGFESRKSPLELVEETERRTLAVEDIMEMVIRPGPDLWTLGRFLISLSFLKVF